jgi:L,D-peptidoglycan transpeptidase YkuD (ErfK/YbiS/YcfS/YnhG family)
VKDAQQVILVRAEKYGTYKVKYEAYEKVNGIWKVFLSGNGVIGKKGFSDNRKEGDLTTPTGKYGFPYMFGSASNPGVKFKYKKAVYGDYWASNTKLSEYNVWMHYTGPNPRQRLYDYEELWKQP